MKITKKMIALVMATVMLVLPCIPANAASVSMSYSTGFEVADGVQYSKYSTYGSSSGHTETATVLEFHPDDGYIPMAFAAWSGSTGTLQSTYNQAVGSRYGYEVVGAINGSFFDMNTGMLTGIDGGGALLASGGKLSNYSFGLYSYGSKFDVVAFGGDGSMQFVQSQLYHKVYFNGEYIEHALRGVNINQAYDDYRPDAIFYWDEDCGSYADSSYGYEIVCEKVDGTDLRIGEKMVGKVVSVKGYTSGSSIGENQFVLNTPSGSSYESYMKALKVGDTVEIEVMETVSGSEQIMKEAYSVITNCGMLVKDGVDMTSSGTIGGHSVYTYARWTVFGQKADGTIVFMTTEGGDTGTTSRSLNLQDVAAAMIKLGCVNVVRMDGGGSTGMYVSNTGSGSAGYVMSSSRAVADAMLIVKKTGDSNLRTAIAEAGSISHTDYTATELKAIRAAYDEAVATYSSTSATNEQKQAAADKLNALVKKSGPVIENGDQFWLTHYNTLNNEGSGAVMTETYTGGAWWLHVAFSPVAGTSAYEITAISNGLSNGSGSALAIPTGGFVYALNLGNSPYNSAAVQAMVARANQWKVGDQFIFSGLDLSNKSVPTTTAGTSWYLSSYVCTGVMAPYVPGEEVGESNVSNGVYITGFNSSILGGNATIFTSDFNGGQITGTAANHLWTYNVVLQWDATVGAYRVIQSFAGAGSGNTPDIELSEDMILIAVHDNGDTASSTNKALLSQAQVGQVLNLYGIDIESRSFTVAPYLTITDRVDTSIFYQTSGDDVRLVAYVDDYEAYSSVTFSLIIDGDESSAVEVTTAYAGLYANGTLYTTKDIFGEEGYFVTLIIREYVGEFGGAEATFVATYTTITGETFSDTRTVIIE